MERERKKTNISKWAVSSWPWLLKQTRRVHLETFQTLGKERKNIRAQLLLSVGLLYSSLTQGTGDQDLASPTRMWHKSILQVQNTQGAAPNISSFVGVTSYDSGAGEYHSGEGSSG